MPRKIIAQTNIDHIVAHKIRNLRIAMGLSRSQLAGTIGVTHQQLGKYENGANRICSGRLLAIAHALREPISFFFEEEDFYTPLTNQRKRLSIELMREFRNIDNASVQDSFVMLMRNFNRAKNLQNRTKPII